MSAPIWLASPPEVHSTLLSAGPGPGPLLAAGAAWSALSAEYATTAVELEAVLADVAAGAWQGPTAAQYVAAHGPYLAWLTERAARSATAAALHHTAAGAYTTALAVMPTMAELTLNHTTHAVLVATNFFGINLIPIALNEADYVRMWIQAATTMGGYQATAAAAVASAPAADPAPPITSGAGSADSGTTNPPSTPPAGSALDQWIADLLTKYNMGFADPIAKQLWKLLGFNDYPIAAYPFASAVGQLLMNIPGMSPVLANALGWSTFHTLMLLLPLGIITAQLALPLMMAAAPALAAAAPVAALGGLGALGALGAISPAQPMPAITTPPTAPAPAPGTVPAGGGEICACPDPVPPGNPPATVPAGAPAALPAGGTPPGGGFGFGSGVDGFYLACGIGAAASRGAGRRRSTAVEEKAPESEAAPGETAVEEQRRARRRRARLKQHGYGDEYLTADIGVTPDWAEPATTGSERGAGPLGFTGTEARTDRRAAGLAAVGATGLGDGARVPMLPGGWGEE